MGPASRVGAVNTKLSQCKLNLRRSLKEGKAGSVVWKDLLNRDGNYLSGRGKIESSTA